MHENKSFYMESGGFNKKFLLTKGKPHGSIFLQQAVFSKIVDIISIFLSSFFLEAAQTFEVHLFLMQNFSIYLKAHTRLLFL